MVAAGDAVGGAAPAAGDSVAVVVAVGCCCCAGESVATSGRTGMGAKVAPTARGDGVRSTTMQGASNALTPQRRFPLMMLLSQQVADPRSPQPEPPAAGCLSQCARVIKQ